MKAQVHLKYQRAIRVQDVFIKQISLVADKGKLEPQGALIAHLSTMSTSVIS